MVLRNFLIRSTLNGRSTLNKGYSIFQVNRFYHFLSFSSAEVDDRAREPSLHDQLFSRQGPSRNHHRTCAQYHGAGQRIHSLGLRVISCKSAI